MAANSVEAFLEARGTSRRELFRQLQDRFTVIETAAGILIVRSQFDNQLGGLGTALDGVMNEWHQERVFITGAGGGLAGLEAAPLSYAVADATVVFNTGADIGNELWSIYTGAATQASFRAGAYDYRTNLSLIAGTDIH